MSDDFGDLGFGNAVAKRAFDVHSKLLWTIQRYQGRDRDETAVALGKLGPLPHVAEDDLVREINELGDRGANLLARRVQRRF